MPLHDLSNTIEDALGAAGLDTRTSHATVAVIRNALEAARIAQQPRAGQRADAGDVIDVEAEEIAPETAGRFLALHHTGPHGRLAYKLYVPAAHARGEPLPLVVMLHGCKQNPDDFARGTRINALAEEQGFLVAYPAQPAKANGSNCWNWFEPRHQAREGAEPSTIVGIVREIARSHRVDERRVFVAGLSAGAAMAVILGEAYPEVFAGVAAHSGLPNRVAHDVPSAFAAMHGSAPPRAAHAGDSRGAVPTIVFHGEADTTVVPGNGAAIAEQSVARLQAQRGPLTREVERREAHGRRCTRTTHVDRDGLPVVEQWSVAGAGHAWLGGSRAGSFADPRGPDATREMMRFFRSHARREG